jgi:hypothetical protein
MNINILRVVILAALLFLSGLVSGCKTHSILVEEQNGSTVSFDSYISKTPIKINADHVYYSDVPYGSHERNVFDLWVADDGGNAPLIIYIHGGGFQGGDKKSAWDRTSKYGIGSGQIEEFLEQGISFATINYRLLEKNDREGVLKSLNDSKRAIQYLRHHSNELGFNGELIGLAGSSAGAGTALWLAFHDDMADADNSDPVLRESTRVQAVAAQETQSTYDILRWSEDVFPNDAFSIEKVKGTALGNRLMVFYGVNDLNELENDDLVAYRKEVDMLSMISSDDPAVFILNKKDFRPEKGNIVGNLLHSPYHAVALKKEIDRAGIPNEIYIPADGTVPGKNATVADFLISQLKK